MQARPDQALHLISERPQRVAYVAVHESGVDPSGGSRRRGKIPVMGAEADVRRTRRHPMIGAMRCATADGLPNAVTPTDAWSQSVTPHRQVPVWSPAGRRKSYVNCLFVPRRRRHQPRVAAAETQQTLPSASIPTTASSMAIITAANRSRAPQRPRSGRPAKRNHTRRNNSDRGQPGLFSPRSVHVIPLEVIAPTEYQQTWPARDSILTFEAARPSDLLSLDCPRKKGTTAS
jgi:hypothetical protein